VEHGFWFLIPVRLSAIFLAGLTLRHVQVGRKSRFAPHRRIAISREILCFRFAKNM
jgi:hypothetical protein